MRKLKIIVATIIICLALSGLALAERSDVAPHVQFSDGPVLIH